MKRWIAHNYKWFLVGMLWFTALLNYLDRQMLSTMKLAIQVDIAELESAANFGRLMAVFLWIYGIMSPVAGVVADRLNKKWLIVGSLFVWSVVTFLMSFASTFNELYILRALMGISEALYMPTSLAMIAEAHSSKTRSMAVGLHMTGFYVGQSLGGFGANIADTISWQNTFGLFGAVGMLYSVFLIFGLRNGESTLLKDSPTKPHLFSGVGKLLGSFTFIIILLYFTLPGIPGWAIKNWLPTLFSENLNIPMTSAGPMAAVTFSVASLVGVLIGGRLSDKWIQKNLRGRLYTSAIGVAMCIPALLLMAYGQSVLVCVMAALCGGFGFGLFDTNNMPIVCQFVSPGKRATAYGLMNMSGVFSGAFATGVLGRFSDENKLHEAFAWLVVVVVIAIVLQMSFLRPKTDDFKDS